MAAADETPRAYLPLSQDRVTRRRIAVIGGGLMGTATAYAAARLGGGAVTVDLCEAEQRPRFQVRPADWPTTG